MLLKTRFYLPPLRTGNVVRGRLLNRLNESSGGSLVLVSAPAGYGKTTLVSQWLHSRSHRFAWLSLGSEHDVLDVFWQYAIQSLQQIEPQIGHEAHSIWLESPRRNYASVVISLLNDLDALGERNQSDDPISLVLDDFHLIKNPQLLSLFSTFLDHLPSSIRVVVTSRDLPDLCLARRRASGQLLHVAVEELRFNDEEAVAFFDHDPALSQNNVVAMALAQKTEGWVAGMQLVALSLKQDAVRADQLLKSQALDRHISDYLLEEVFSSQPEALKQFLLLTALAPRFCAGLSNAVCQRNDGLQVIVELESSDLFLVALDNHRTWYRYHDLFRRFLLQQVAQWDAQQRTAFCVRALAWLEANGNYDDAVELCLQQSLWPQLLRLLNSDWMLLEAGYQQKRLHWLEQIPQDVLLNTPEYSEQGAPEHRPLKSRALNVPKEDHPSIEPLTRREQVVLQLIGEGLSNKAIAEQLHISLNTLKVHIRNLYGKMGVENRTQALLKINAN